MDNGRRSGIREARRERRRQRGHGGDEDAPAAAAAAPAPNSISALRAANNNNNSNAPPPLPAVPQAAAAPARRRRNDADLLADKMRKKNAQKNQSDKLLSERELVIRKLYAPEMEEENALNPHANAVDYFDKDDILSSFITDTRANFLKLDQELSEDHKIATQRLHTQVFANANNFLLLFRDVARANDLVEALKANVQGTKASISAISKITYSNVGNTNKSNAKESSSATDAHNSGSVFGGGAMTAKAEGGSSSSAFLSRVRPSLVTRRMQLRTGDTHGGGSHGTNMDSIPDVVVEYRNTALAGYQATATAEGPAATVGDDSVTRNKSVLSPVGPSPSQQQQQQQQGRGGGTGLKSNSDRGSYSTTHALNVSSFQQWALLINQARSTSASASAALRRSASATGDDSATKSSRWSKNNKEDANAAAAHAAGRRDDVQVFADVVNEETDQLLSERRHLEVAELLRSVSAEATAKGCLPLVLDLEAALVVAVVSKLYAVPITPMYAESVHIPLIQLLMRFGRIKTGSFAYLMLQTQWMDDSLTKLQSRVNPYNASRITVDFLVRVIRDVLRRQHTLWLPLADAKRVLAEEDEGAKGGAGEAGTTTTTGAGGKIMRIVTKSKREAVAAKNAANKAAGGELIPPNSAALLWVRYNVQRFAREVLATHLLSYGTGTDGGDPSRICRAASMIAESVRMFRTLTADGFAGCDTLTLRQLTPSLVLLESDFTKLTEVKMSNTSRAMAEEVITASLYMYETSGAGYNAGACEVAARKAITQSQELLKWVTHLPACSHTWLVQLLLSPALSMMFDRNCRRVLPCLSSSSSATSAATASTFANANSGGGGVGYLLPPEQYRFLRYSNSCTTVHTILVRSLLKFVAAIAGAEQLPKRPSVVAAVAAVVSSTSNASAPVSMINRDRRGGGGGGGASPRPILPIDDGSGATSATIFHQQVECASFLLSNALISESMDVSMQQLFVGFLYGILRQRDALVKFFASDRFARAQRRTFGDAKNPAKTPASALPPLLQDPASSPAWAMDALLALTNDVMSVGVWVSYIARGGALAHLLSDNDLLFRTQHVETLRLRMPEVVQGALATTFVIGFRADAAKGLLPRTVAAAPTPTPAPAAAGGAAAGTPAAPASPTASGGPALPGSSAGDALLLASAQSAQLQGTSAALLRRSLDNSSFALKHRESLPQGGGGGAAATLAAGSSSPLAGQSSSFVGSPSLAPEGGTNLITSVSVPVHDHLVDDAPEALPLLDEAKVNMGKLLPLLMTLLDRRFCTPTGFSAHRYCPASLTYPPTKVLGSGERLVLMEPWCLRAALPRYPEFPIGIPFDQKDEVFLFHWVAQISLHLVATFQERLLTPSYVLNRTSTEQRAGAAAAAGKGTPSLPVRGCVSAQEDSAVAALCAGGGHYVTAVASLQFLFLRLLHDALCRTDTWVAVYSCPVAAWRAKEEVLRQQVFFFALLLRVWSPLFTGGLRVPVLGTEDRSSKGAGNKAAPPPETISSMGVDGLPALTVLEWLTGSGLVPPPAVDAAAAAPAGGGMYSAASLGTSHRAATAVEELLTKPGFLPVAPPATTSSNRAGGGKTATAEHNREWRKQMGAQGKTADSASSESKTTASSNTGGGARVSVTSAAAVAASLAECGSRYLPDTPLRVVQHFFEEALLEPRGMPAVTSDVTRQRVDRAMSSIDLRGFMDSSLGVASSSEEEEEEEEGENSRSSSRSSSAVGGGAATSAKLTLLDIRDLVEYYVKPLL